ncbi:Fe-S cluster assembly scaffold SufA [Pantoea sp. BAV 3049]|uniref:Fe-S cluster assembly scaffold SufA n=1 Tax=Pantoea sp. BAV 3049 TaxID=2654188 RepID=UPI00131CF487|nr:Fe-S cluster assembly scaffold SufA [Pantoea sp. BAV 3049]
MPSATTASFSPDDYVWKGLTLTDSAAKQITTLAAGDPGVLGLKLGVKTSGCAGFGYTMDLIKEPADDDLVFTHEGASLYVPLQAMPFIDGTEVDFVREGLNQIFKFNNPKAQHACGCGESFGVE